MLTPDYYYDSIFEIPYDELSRQKIRGLIFDIDNTLTAFDEALPPAKVSALIKRLKNKGFQICLLTNNTKKRLAGFNKHLRLPGIARALKPFTRGIKKAMEKMGTTRENTAIIGDQLLSDIWGGKNAGIVTILVKPTTEKDFILVKAKRVIERIMLRKFFAELKLNENK